MSVALVILVGILVLLAFLVTAVEDDRRSQRIRELTGEERFRLEAN